MAMVCCREECKLRVGGMSVTELWEQLQNYWGDRGFLGGAVEECYRVPIPEKGLYQIRRVPFKFTVFSQWLNREYTQWLSYFIAKNHTLGAVHAWFTAFLGVTNESMLNLAKSFANIPQCQDPQCQDPESKAFMESVHRIKICMSFDVCIKGHVTAPR